MIWFIFASLTAVFESLKDVTSKRGLKNIDEYVITWALVFFTLPLLVPLLFFIPIPQLGGGFVWALLVGGSLNILSFTLYIRALKLSDLSLAVPLVTFTPLFLLFTAPLIVGENPTVFDGLGIVLIVVGSYILNLREQAEGFLAPLRSLFYEPGSRLMLFVAFLWSVTSTVDKVGVQNSSPTFWAVTNYSFIAVGILPILWYRSRQNLNQIFVHLKALVPIGLFHGAAVLFQMQAISLTLVAQVIAVKRMSALLSVFFGHLIFQEPGITQRATGAAVMIAGVALTTLF